MGTGLSLLEFFFICNADKIFLFRSSSSFFSRVYRSVQKKSGLCVALKVFQANVSEDEGVTLFK
jgi:hypothetical protein